MMDYALLHRMKAILREFNPHHFSEASKTNVYPTLIQNIRDLTEIRTGGIKHLKVILDEYPDTANTAVYDSLYKELKEAYNTLKVEFYD